MYLKDLTEKHLTKTETENIIIIFIKNLNEINYLLTRVMPDLSFCPSGFSQKGRNKI